MKGGHYSFLLKHREGPPINCLRNISAIAQEQEECLGTRLAHISTHARRTINFSVSAC